MPVQLHNPQPAPEAPPADPDLTRCIELVVTDADGDILARTGIRVSAIEAHFILTYGFDWDYFRLGFQPAEGVEAPRGCEWNAESGLWEREPDEERAAYRVSHRKPGDKWQVGLPSGTLAEALAYVEGFSRRLPGVPLRIDPATTAAKRKGGAA